MSQSAAGTGCINENAQEYSDETELHYLVLSIKDHLLHPWNPKKPTPLPSEDAMTQAACQKLCKEYVETYKRPGCCAYSGGADKKCTFALYMKASKSFSKAIWQFNWMVIVPTWTWNGGPVFEVDSEMFATSCQKWSNYVDF